eukprot:4825530-Prymnesium_polylepis.1
MAGASVISASSQRTVGRPAQDAPLVIRRSPSETTHVLAAAKADSSLLQVAANAWSVRKGPINRKGRQSSAHRVA